MSRYESETQTKILKYFKTLGIYAVKIILANRDGVPDILCCIDGHFIAFEGKRQGEEAQELQKYNIRQIQKAGGKAFVVESLQEVKDILGNI